MEHAWNDLEHRNFLDIPRQMTTQSESKQIVKTVTMKQFWIHVKYYILLIFDYKYTLISLWPYEIKLNFGSFRARYIAIIGII